MVRIEIRDERPADYSKVDDLIRAAFNGDAQAQIVTALRESDERYISLVAEQDGLLVGHICFSPIEFEEGFNHQGCQLSPISVSPIEQGKGIGGELINAGLERCKIVGWNSVFLLGNPAYYSRFGFMFASEIGLHCNGSLDPYLQYVELESGILNDCHGLISFHSAFNPPDT